MSARALTANRLTDGAVVYLGAGDAWVETLAAAVTVRGEAGEQRLLAAGADAVARRLVVGPYLIPVALGGAAPAAVSQRERIRAAGPTVACGPERTR